jgi:hypothetical protein
MAGRGAKPGERRGGRSKGTPNKLTGDLRAMILGALDAAGGEKYLTRQADQSPAAFMALLGKVLPTKIEGSLAIDATDISTLSDQDLAERIARLGRAELARRTPTAPRM